MMKIRARYPAAAFLVIGTLALLVWGWALLVRFGVSLDSKYEVLDEQFLKTKDLHWGEVQFLSGWIGLGCLLLLAVLLGYRWFIRPSKA